MPGSLGIVGSLLAMVLLGLDPGGSGLLARYDFDRRSGRMDLPEALDEVSGLAISKDGRLFAHADERAWVHELDPAAGTAGKRFMLGDRTARDDFEGITFVGDRLFLVSSGGFLYESREGEDREEMPYRRTSSGVGETCEVEGLEHRPDTDELLLACKVVTRESGVFVVHRIPVAPEGERPAPIRVWLGALEPFGLEPRFHPSGIVWSAETRTLLIVSARDEALVEIDPAGSVIGAVKLSKRRHAQTEGIAIGPDGTLYLADERNGRSPRLTWYSPIDRGGGS